MTDTIKHANNKAIISEVVLELQSIRDYPNKEQSIGQVKWELTRAIRLLEQCLQNIE